MRIDGPIKLIRGRQLYYDKLFFRLIELFASGVVFQSNWSYKRCVELGYNNKVPHAIILNAPDKSIFYKSKKKQDDDKFKIIATSWSDNMRKGFDVYKWLDENLDFDKYEMTFVGNRPVDFKNVIKIPPVNSNELASILRNSDLYLTASKSDPCSNSLLEALCCGLPAIVFNDGGHPEIIGLGGEVFSSKEEIPLLLEKIKEKYQNYVSLINVRNISNIANEYLCFMERVALKTKISFLDLLIGFFEILLVKFRERVKL